MRGKWLTDKRLSSIGDHWVQVETQLKKRVAVFRIEVD